MIWHTGVPRLEQIWNPWSPCGTHARFHVAPDPANLQVNVTGSHLEESQLGSTTNKVVLHLFHVKPYI